MFFKNKLKKIEKKISAIQRNSVADSENFGNSANIRKTKREAEIAVLESEKQSILNKQNSLMSKVLWGALVPFVVAIITAYVVTRFINVY